jgi:hypothetical protein
MLKNKVSHFLFLPLILIAVFSFAQNAFASTTINADVTENTTWTQENSPYIVAIPITIATNTTLTIEPDVIVKFDYEASLFVEGVINALGTKIAPIYFTSNYDDAIGGNTDDEEFCYENIDEEGNSLGEVCESFDLGDPFMGDWGGIYFLNSLNSSFKNVFFRYTDDALIFQSSSASFESLNINESFSGLMAYMDSHVEILDSVFGNLWGNAVWIFNDSSLVLNKSSISNTIDGISIHNNSSATITDFNLTCAGDGLSIHDNSTLNFSKGSIACGGYGMYFYSEAKATIDNIKISGAANAGIIAFSNFNPNPITITKSEITGNEYGFMVFNTGISSHQNSIHGNNTNGVLTFSPLTPNQFDFTSNYWGDPSGPQHSSNPSGLGDIVSDDILFTPWLISDPLVTCCSNVLFLPGLEASRLYKQKTILGFPVEDQLWEPNLPSDVDDLYLNTDGTSKNSSIYTKDIIGTTNVLPIFTQDVYKNLIVELDNLVSTGKISNWKPYAYDWRQGIDDLIRNGTKYNDGQIFSLIGILQSLVSTSKTGKVTIIAHSNGGLLGKALIKKLEDMKSLGQNDLVDHIDNLVLVASPQLGTPDAISSILHGYGKQLLAGFLMDEVQARKLAQNMSSAYGLLPSKKYYDQSNVIPPGVFDYSSAQIYKTAYGTDINNYQEEHDFLLGKEGRTQPAENNLILPIRGNSSLLTQAESLHDVIDNMIFPSSVKVVNIAGWGKETIVGMTYTDSDIQPIFTIRGDKTVVIQSALYGQGTKYWLDLSNSKLDHGNILEDPQLLDFINNLIIQKPIVNNMEPTQIGNRLHLSVHSPVSIGIYDNQGNFTGKVCDDATGNCIAKENIPGSTYFEFGEGKYINLSQDDIQKAVLQGTDIGTFTFESQTITPSGQINTSSFVDIPVTTQTQAEVTFNPDTQLPQLALDVTGDGVMDFVLAPNDNFDPITYLQIMKATIDSLDLNKAKIKAFDNKVDSIIKAIQKGKIKKAELKAEKFKKVLEKKLAKPDPKHTKPKKLSKTDAQLLLDMLNKLLDNIS